MVGMYAPITPIYIYDTLNLNEQEFLLAEQ